MRISDWSSDVCSSDLREHVLTRVLAELIGAEARKIRMRGRRADLRDLGLGEDRCSSQRGGGGEAADGQHEAGRGDEFLRDACGLSWRIAVVLDQDLERAPLDAAGCIDLVFIEFERVAEPLAARRSEGQTSELQSL